MWFSIAMAFVRRNWKAFALIGAAIAAYFLFNHWLSGVKKESYDKGALHERTYWQGEVKRINNENREFERKLTDQVISLGKEFAKRDADRVEKETTHTNTIREILKSDPKSTQCQVDQKVLDERNEIRRLGPNPGA